MRSWKVTYIHSSILSLIDHSFVHSFIIHSFIHSFIITFILYYLDAEERGQLYE